MNRKVLLSPHLFLTKVEASAFALASIVAVLGLSKHA